MSKLKFSNWGLGVLLLAAWSQTPAAPPQAPPPGAQPPLSCRCNANDAVPTAAPIACQPGLQLACHCQNQQQMCIDPTLFRMPGLVKFIMQKPVPKN